MKFSVDVAVAGAGAVGGLVFLVLLLATAVARSEQQK